MFKFKWITVLKNITFKIGHVFVYKFPAYTKVIYRLIHFLSKCVSEYIVLLAMLPPLSPLCSSYNLLSHWCMLCVMPCVLYSEIWFNCQIHCQYEKCYTSVMWTKFIWGGLDTGYIVTYVVTPADNLATSRAASHIQHWSKGNCFIWDLLNAIMHYRGRLKAIFLHPFKLPCAVPSTANMKQVEDVQKQALCDLRDELDV